MRRAARWRGLLCALLAAGCGDVATGGDGGADAAGIPPGDAAGGDAAGGSGGCGFPAAGGKGVASIAAPSLAIVDERSGTAASTADLERDAQLGPASLQASPTGGIGLLRWQQVAGKTAIVYQGIRPASPASTVDAAATAGARDAALLFDAAGQPLVVRGTAAGYVEQSGATWAKKAILADPFTALGGKVSGLTHHSASAGLDGKLHVFAQASVGGVGKLVHGARPAAGGEWTFAALPLPPASEVHGYRVDAAGTIHATFRNTTFPCDPCNMDLYHGTLAPGGAWATTVVQAGKWGAPDDEFVESSSLDLGPDGAPWVAAHFVRRVVTGSYRSAELRLYGRVAGAWCGETVAAMSDGFAGQDGAAFTGANPSLRVDGQGRMHLAFSDQALWHDAEGRQNESRGQLRYAVRSGGLWTVITLVSQKGQGASPQPLHRLVAPQVAVSGDATRLVGVGVQQVWQAGSIYGTTPAAVTHQLTLLEADLVLP